MKCNEFLEHLSQYVENDLAEDKKRECDEHLFSCEKCREAFEEEKEINRLFAEAMNAEEVVFESRIDNVMKSIDKEKYSKNSGNVVSMESKKKKRFFNKKVMGLAAVCAVCIYFAPGVLEIGMSNNKDSAMFEKASDDGAMMEAKSIGTMTAESEGSNMSNVRSFTVEGKDDEMNDAGDEPLVSSYGDLRDNSQKDSSDQDDSNIEVGTTAEATMEVAEEEDKSNQVKEEVPQVKTAIKTDKTEYTGKTTVKGGAAVPGLYDDENKLNDILEKETYLMENFGIKVIRNKEESYIDNNGKKQTFGFEFGSIEECDEDEKYIYMIYRGNKEVGGKLTSKVLKFHKDSKKMEEIYEIDSSEVIDSLIIEEDGLVYTIKHDEKVKSFKIEK